MKKSHSEFKGSAEPFEGCSRIALETFLTDETFFQVLGPKWAHEEGHLSNDVAELAAKFLVAQMQEGNARFTLDVSETAQDESTTH